jgi:hypothetical protein
MALARIITRSQVCARELASDLLARGYAVEIVTPDSVPGNRADLELRVEENAGNQLVASVQAHDGRRSASFEFRHQLRAPIADFLRKTQQTTEVIYLSGGPDSFVAEPQTEPLELPASPQLELKTVSAPAPVLLDASSHSGSDSGSDGSRLTASRSADSIPANPSRQKTAPIPTLPEPQPPLSMKTVAAAEAPSPIAPPLRAPISTPPAMAQSRPKPHTRKRPPRWEWRAALAFTSMVSLALLLGLGTRRSEKTYAPVSEALSAQRVSTPSIDGSPSVAGSPDNPQDDSTAVHGKIDSSPLSPSLMEWGWDHTTKNSTADNAEEAVVRASVVHKMALDQTGHHEGGLIARDTVTYLDPRYRPSAPKGRSANRSARRYAAPHKHNGGVIAVNTVTYLNKPTPKPAK